MRLMQEVRSQAAPRSHFYFDFLYFEDSLDDAGDVYDTKYVTVCTIFPSRSIMSQTEEMLGKSSRDYYIYMYYIDPLVMNCKEVYLAIERYLTDLVLH